MNNKTFILSMAILLLVACSKNGDSREVAVEKASFPKKISLEYNTGQSVQYTLEYNSDNQLVRIESERLSGTETIQSSFDFLYNEKRQLKSVSGLSQPDAHTGFSFEYDENNIVSGIEYVSSESEAELNVSYSGPNTNGYTVEGPLGNLPTILDFDAQNSLEGMAILETIFGLVKSGSGKGLFHNMETQPAMAIWNALQFYLIPYELFFFNRNDLDSFVVNGTDTFHYENKIWDVGGNLISFQLVQSIPSGMTINYTISYEERNL